MERRKRLLLFFVCAATLEICRNTETSCLAAGFSECCEVRGSQTCQLQSGCYCDGSCYAADNCCTDIGSICSSDFCTPDPCQNGGVCVITSESDFVCQCAYGYAGEFCETDINFCDSGPCLNGGNCRDGIFTFTCDCRSGFSGRQCQVNIDECESSPCQFGTCTDGEGQYTCVCDSGFTGVDCDMNIDDCDPDPCVNGSCIDGVDAYTCDCDPSFAGVDCSIMTECSVEEDTCQNNGLCSVTFEGGNRETFCICLDGYTGDSCEINTNECAGSPCLNGATCLDLIGEYTCNCPMDFTGLNCSIKIDLCDPTAVPCENDALCREGECFCRNGFTGLLCEINIDDCLQAPCYNNATCIDDVAGFLCQCTEEFSGILCNISSSHLCSLSPCHNGGTCEMTSSTEYTCTCSSGFTGVNCSEVTDSCLSAPCSNNNTEACKNVEDGFVCICLPGYTGPTCGNEIDECALLEPCVNEGECIDILNDYMCVCADGYEGRNCQDEIDECMSNPCQNNGTCADEIAQYQCICPAGYTGEQCQVYLDDCIPLPCQNNATCEDLVADYLCLCSLGYTGRNCSMEMLGCSGEPCANGGTCEELGGSYRCECAPGFTGDNCTACLTGFQGQFCQDVDECNTTASPCMNGGECLNTHGGFFCNCPSGFTGQSCEDNFNDDCNPNVCMNSATCVDTGDNFECVCPPGYTGPVCDLETLECDSNPCQNGGQCHEEFLNFTCTCTADYAGRTCEINLNPCSSDPCMNAADCFNGAPGSEQFTCTCSPGYTGVLCDEDIDDCESNPCLMDSTCIDAINNFTCECASGFGGHLCDINLIDNCDLPYCLNGTCKDIGDDYICICDAGFTGPNCEFNINECLDNPCFNNATCRDLPGSYECICLPGFSGPACKIDIDECIGVNCNNGTCRDLVSAFSCDCIPGYMGDKCETDRNECAEVMCLFGGTCVDQVNNYTCECASGFQGRLCGENIDDCVEEVDCGNGTCQDLVDDYFCQCVVGYTGSACDVMIDECDQQPCMNNATCVDALNNFTCLCLGGFQGRYCETNIDECISGNCLNDATCIDGINSYTCECGFGYEGEDCGMLLDFCTPDSCVNDGTCITTFPGSTDCFCTPFYTGSRCEITPCHNFPCENEGTCLLDSTSDLGYICQCSLTWYGTNCTEEINIVTPSFNGNSYLSHALPPPTSVEFNYSLALLTTNMSGLLLYIAQSDSQNYITLGLESGQLILHLGTESGSIELRTQVTTNDSAWHVVELHVGTQEASLQVDSEIQRVSISRDTPLDIGTLVYIGGLPDLTLLPSDVMQTTGLVGCVHDRMANGQSVQLAMVDHEGRNVVQCTEPVCSYIQCQNGADCIELTVFPGFVCECPPFYSGVYCETPLPFCQPNPCLFGGLCREEQSVFSCLCPLGRAGRTCEEEPSISVPSFSGESYITYPPNTILPARTLTVTITFSPVSSSGMLFFTSTSEMEFNDYFSLALVDGRLELRYNLGSGGFIVRSENEVELNTWHAVTATLSFGRGELTVDNEPLITGSSQSIFTVLDAQNSIWLGGYENFVDLTSISGTADGFNGCISSLTIDDSTLDLIIDADNGYDVTQCDTSSCTNAPCMNGGSCIEEGPSFVCVCPPGVVGILCSNMADRCLTEPDLCAEGATCVNSEDGLTFFCLCPVGRDGERCDEDIQIQTPEFNSTSYLQYNPYTPLSTVAISFIPATPHGLLFYYGDYTQNRDFISIAMIEQRVEFRYNLGSGPAILISNPVDLNAWHYVVVSLDGPNGSMIVDGGVEIHNDFEGLLSVLNAAGDMFVGGVSNYSTVSPHVGTEVGLTGCINDVEINYMAVDLLGAAVGGRGIAECSIDPCADLTCSNGGSCEVTISSGPMCLCTLSFAGPTCNMAIDIAEPYFTGQSHIAYDTLTNVFATTALTLEIRPSSPNGLVLFNQQMDGVDYIAVILRDGVVEFWYNLGSGAAIISSMEPVELYVWHTIEVYRSGASGQLIVDGTLPVSGSSEGDYTGLQLGDPLYIGGVSDSAAGNLPLQFSKIGGYQGCIRSVSSFAVPLLLISDAISGVGVQECPLLPCTSSPCLNNGVCFVETGNGSSGQQCLCSLPFTGETCAERVESISEAMFSGQSYLQYSADAVAIELQRISTHLEITFTPSSLTGLLFYMGPADARTNDYLYIALSDGLVELTFKLNVLDEVSVTTAQPLLVGENYTVVVQRTNGNSMLSVSNGATVEVTSDSSSFESDSTFVAYLGGAPSVAALTRGTYSSGIRGCVSAVNIGRVGNTEHLPLSSATSGTAVDLCS